MLKCIGPAAGCERARPERDVAAPASRRRPRARAAGRRAPRARLRARSFSSTAAGTVNGAATGLRAQGRTPSREYNPYSDETPARSRSAWLALGAAGRSRGGERTPRVLAIHFDTDVNPVTQDWLNHELGRAQSGGYVGGGDRARHAGRARGVDAQDRAARALAEDPGDRLRRAERRARRVGRRLDLPGGRRARDGAGDEHRLVDADQRQRHEHRQRPAPQGRERRGRVAARAREDRTAATRRGPTPPCARRRT